MAYVLIGPPAAGKSTVGKLLAARLGVRFADSDTLFEQEFGPITAFFETAGELAFRDNEARTVARLLQNAEYADAVVALGGGAVLAPATRALLRAHCVVFLDSSAAAAAARLGDGTGRPLLRGGPERWQQLYDERSQLYRELAQMRIDTSFGPPERVADELHALLTTPSAFQEVSDDRS